MAPRNENIYDDVYSYTISLLCVGSSLERRVRARENVLA